MSFIIQVLKKIRLVKNHAVLWFKIYTFQLFGLVFEILCELSLIRTSD